jgi:hypothetical protein
MIRTPIHSQNTRLIALAALAFVLFNFPLLDIFRQPMFIFGLPAIYVYLFAGWFGIIVLARRIVEGKRLPFVKRKD